MVVRYLSTAHTRSLACVRGLQKLFARLAEEKCAAGQQGRRTHNRPEFVRDGFHCLQWLRRACGHGCRDPEWLSARANCQMSVLGSSVRTRSFLRGAETVRMDVGGCGQTPGKLQVCSVGDLRISMLFCFGYVCSVGDCGCDSAVSVAVLCCSLTLHYLTSVRDVTV